MVELYLKSINYGNIAKGVAAKLTGIQSWRLMPGAVAMPVFLGFFEPVILQVIWICFWWSTFFLVPVILFRSVCTWGRPDDSIVSVFGQFIRQGILGAADGPNLKYAGFPAVTIGLVLVNTVLFFFAPDGIIEQLCFLPVSDLDLLQIITTTVICGYFHADFYQLFINMIFLWFFGATLEPRIGQGRLIGVCFLSSVISNLISLNLLLDQTHVYDDHRQILEYHSIGASAAIAGLMGLFVVRCHSARLSFSLPILLNSWFPFSLRINGILLIGLFFARDLAGSGIQMHYNTVMIDCWGHVGGFLGGVMLALIFNLQNAGNHEAREVQAEIGRQLSD